MRAFQWTLRLIYLMNGDEGLVGMGRAEVGEEVEVEVEVEEEEEEEEEVGD